MKHKGRKWAFVAVAVAIVVFLGLTLGDTFLTGLSIKKPAQGSQDGEKVLYHTFTCPHCENVRDYIEENGITGITEKEISISQVAANELYDRMVECGKDASKGLTVPVLWDNGECFFGDTDIINHLQGPTSENE